MHRRAFHVGLIGICLLALLGAPPSVRAQDDGPIQFNVGRGVSNEDASYVIEGARLAVDYLGREVGFRPADTINVSIRQQAAKGNPGLVAATIGTSIVVYTGSDGWEASAPFERVGVLIHEFVHVYKNEVVGDDAQTASWFDEGLAEFLRTRVIVGLGLAKQADADAYRAYVLNQESPDFELADIEDLSDFQAESAAVYELSYFAVSLLFGEREFSDVAEYYQAIAVGLPWTEAFNSVFQETPKTFYDAFASWRETLIAASEPPAAYEIEQPASLAAAVRLATLSETVAPGEQALFTARSKPSAICRWQLTVAGSAVPAAKFLTFVDGAGRVFWLYTLPDETPLGQASVSVDCGADFATATFDVSAAPAGASDTAADATTESVVSKVAVGCQLYYSANWNIPGPVIPDGTTVEVIAAANDEWSHIQLPNGKTGFVPSYCLTTA